MERDSRRDRGQWRGCHNFKDIINDGDSGSTAARRDGALKMGQTYYYYYELDGTMETHDPAMPSTSACPYLPGQRVNTVTVPVERTLRKRSASLSSMRHEDFKTMNPEDKFVSPRPAPSPPVEPSRRLGTSTVILRPQRSARSLSPAAGWPWSPRKMFSRKSNSSLADRGRSHAPELGQYPGYLPDDQQSIASSDGVRSRDMSPESLRRFLSDDAAPSPDNLDTADLQPIYIPEDIAEENEEDDNFATSAASETAPFTILSPPPTQRSSSRQSSTSTLLSASPLRPTSPNVETAAFPEPPSRSPPRIPLGLRMPPQREMFLVAPQQTSWYSPSASFPASPASQDLPSFEYSEDEDEEDDDAQSTNEDGEESFITHHLESDEALETKDKQQGHLHANLAASLSTYSLPQTSLEVGGGKLAADVPPAPFAHLGSPALVARNGTDVPMGNTSLLAAPAADSGLTDLVQELGWMADVIHSKGI